MITVSNRRHTMLTLLSATALTVFGAPAWAGCGTLNSNTYTVSDSQTDCELDSGRNLTVTTSGTITADTQDSAVLIATSNTAGAILNSGTITGSDAAVDGIALLGATAGSITNGGTIQGYRGINIRNGDDGDGGFANSTLTGAITNNLGGTITGDSAAAIEIAYGSTVGGIANSGDITGNRGIYIYQDTTLTGGLTNTATGTITDTSFNNAIQIDDAAIAGGFSNAGMITSDNTGVYFNNVDFTGNFANLASGTIDGGEGGAVDIESSTITGTINNAGTTHSTDGYALYAYNTHITGDVLNSGTISSDYSRALYLYNDTIDGAVTNSGTITSGDDRGIYIRGTSIAGALTNTVDGVIHAYNEGIYIRSNSTVASILNNGEITSDNSDGVYITSSTVTGDITNGATGTITGTDGDGLDIDGTTIGGDITNAGTITGAYDGIYLDDLTVNGDIVNSGTVSATADPANDEGDGLYLDYDTLVNGKIVNTGTIAGNTAGAGLFLYDGATVTGGIDNSGTISGGVGIHLVDGGEGSGPTTISGGILNRADGTISGDTGIYLEGGAVNGGITNAGHILATGDGMSNGSGAALYVTSTLNGGLTNSGTIAGDFVGALFGGSVVTGDITNSGTISGTEGALIIVSSNFAGTVTNSGTLTGGDALYLAGNTGPITVNNTGLMDGDVTLNDNGDTLNLNGFEGRITGILSGDAGSIVNVNGTFTAENTFGVGTLNVVDGGTLNTASQSFTTQNGFNNAGTVVLGNADAPTVTGDYTQAAGGTLRIGVNSATEHGALTVSGVATFAADTKLFVDVAQGNSLAIGTVVPDVVTAGTLDASTFTVADNSLLFNFEAVVDGNTLDLNTVRGLSVVESADSQGNSAGRDAARTLDYILTNNPDGNFDDQIAAFGTLTTQEQVSNAVTQTLPAITGSTTQSSIDTMTTTSRIVQSREEGEQGLSSGDDFVTNGDAWIKPFGSWAKEDSNNGNPGFNSDTYGLIGGADKLVGDTLRLGVALSYANSDITGRGASGGQNVNLNNYQAIGYGSQTVAPKTDVNFQFGGGFSHSNEHRDISFGGLDARARGDYTSYTMLAGAGIGRTLDMDAATTFTPSVRADYLYVRNNSYHERGAGALNLAVDSQSADELVPSIDGKVQHRFGHNISATANLGVGYDVLADRDTVTSSFAGGGPAFSTNGTDPSHWVSHGGVGVTVSQFHGVELTARYDAEVRGTDYDNQTISLKLRAPF